MTYNFTIRQMVAKKVNDDNPEGNVGKGGIPNRRCAAVVCKLSAPQEWTKRRNDLGAICRRSRVGIEKFKMLTTSLPSD